MAGNWVMPEYRLCRFVKQRLAAIRAESPDRTIMAIFGGDLPLGDKPSYEDVRQWFMQQNFVDRVNVGEPTTFTHLPRICFHWHEDTESSFVGNFVSERDDPDTGEPLETRGSEYSGIVMCAIQGYESNEPLWLREIVLQILTTDKAMLEDAGVRAMEGLKSGKFSWEDASNGHLIGGIGITIPCIYNRFIEKKPSTDGLEVIDRITPDFVEDVVDLP